MTTVSPSSKNAPTRHQARVWAWVRESPLWLNALAALDEIGLGEAVRHVGASVTAGAMDWSDGHWLRRPTPERITRALGEPLVVRSSALIDVLAAAIEPGTLQTGSAAMKLVVTATGAQVILLDGTSRSGDAVVGADGTGSMVPRHLNGPLRLPVHGIHRLARYRDDGHGSRTGR